MPVISGQCGASRSTSSPGVYDRAGHRGQAAGGSGGDQDVLPLGRHARACSRLLDEGVEQRRHPWGGA